LSYRPVERTVAAVHRHEPGVSASRAVASNMAAGHAAAIASGASATPARDAVASENVAGAIAREVDVPQSSDNARKVLATCFRTTAPQRDASPVFGRGQHSLMDNSAPTRGRHPGAARPWQHRPCANCRALTAVWRTARSAPARDARARQTTRPRTRDLSADSTWRGCAERYSAPGSSELSESG